MTKDATLKFQAVPVKVKDRKLLLAQQVTIDGKQIEIDRVGRTATRSASAK